MSFLANELLASLGSEQAYRILIASGQCNFGYTLLNFTLTVLPFELGLVLTPQMVIRLDCTLLISMDS